MLGKPIAFYGEMLLIAKRYTWKCLLFADTEVKTTDNKFRTGCIDFTAGSLGKYNFEI